MANTFTNPTWVKGKPHASAEKQIGDSDPSARTDVINRVEKGILAVLKRVFNTITDGVTADFTDQTTITEFANAPIVPRAVSGTPAQHGLFRENVVKAWAHIDIAGSTPTLAGSFNVTSITDGGAGIVTVTWDRDFANVNYAVATAAFVDTTYTVTVPTIAVGSAIFHIRAPATNTLTDDISFMAIAIGGQ